MSSTRLIFTYKRKRLSSRSSATRHADVCPDFSLDVPVGNGQPGPEKGSEKTEKDLMGGVLFQSLEEGHMSNTEVAKSKIAAPLLTFRRRLKRKSDLGGTVVLGMLPTNERAEAIGEEETACELSCSSEIPSNGNFKVANDEAVTRNLSRQSSKTMACDESRAHGPCTRTGADVPVLRHTETKRCSQDDLLLDTSPVNNKITNLGKDIVVLSSNDEVLSSCDNDSQIDEQRASHMAQSFSEGSQFTSCDSSDVKRCAGVMVQQTVSSAPLELSYPSPGAFVIDCNVIPESDLQEIESVQNSSPIVEKSKKAMEIVPLKSKGLDLFGDTDLKVLESPPSDVLRLLCDEHASLAAEKIPKTVCLQLFSVDAQSCPSASTSKNSETGCSRAQRNVVLTLDGRKDQLEQAPTKASAILGLSLAMEPIYEGQIPQRGSDVHSFQDHNVGFKEFIQSPMVHSFPDSSPMIMRHKLLLESCNTRATALRGNRNISLDRFAPCPTMWSEEELDSLWIGIRRHGKGNWHAMLLDPRLRFAPWRVARDLADQWEREQYTFVSGHYMPAGRGVKSPYAYSLNSHTRFTQPKAETQLSLGDVYARKGSGKSRSKVQNQPHMHVTVASNFRKL